MPVTTDGYASVRGDIQPGENPVVTLTFWRENPYIRWWVGHDGTAVGHGAVYERLGIVNVSSTGPVPMQLVVVSPQGQIHGSAGNEHIRLADRPGERGAHFRGNLGNDTLIGASADDLLFGDGQDDVLHGGEGDDALDGGNGNDLILGENGSDNLVPGAGNDTVDGGAGFDTVRYALRYDQLILAQQGDRLRVAGEGTDQLTGVEIIQTSDRTVYVGSGWLSEAVMDGDTLRVTATPTRLVSAIGITTDAATGEAWISDGLTYWRTGDLVVDATGATTLDLSGLTVIGGYSYQTAVSVTWTLGGLKLIGSNQNDSVRVTGADSTLRGGLGNDNLRAEAGANLLDGGEGSDTLISGDGADSLDGGAGSDVLIAAGGNDSLRGGDHRDTLEAGIGDDGLWGDAGDDLLRGGAGNDSIRGWLGFDTIEGGDGDDWINGEQFRDTIMAGAGNDTILNGGNDDIVNGDAGIDTVILWGPQSHWSIDRQQGQVVVWNEVIDVYGTDKLIGIEILQFSDGSIIDLRLPEPT